MLNFKVVLEKCPEGGYVISCPAIQGCHSQGETKAEAIRNIMDAIEGCLEVLNEKASKYRAKNRQIINVAV
jgi:predicted RNase H-like HicB family nuclease